MPHRPSIRPGRRLTALLVATVTLGMLAASAGPADAVARRSSTAQLGGGWLTRQLTHGLIHNDQYAFDDYGLTADTGMALVNIGAHRKAVRHIRHALARHVDSWTTGVDFGSDDIYAGSTAKAVVLAQVTGADPRSFGGVDLVSRLAHRVSSAHGIKGRIQDRSSTDYANVVGQVFAVEGLAAAHSPKAVAARRFLLKQQCSRGFFRLYFADPSAADQSCDGGRSAGASAPDTDATALAVLSLQTLTPSTAKVRRAVGRAVRWLKRHQQPNGSFGGGPTTSASNSNSTGLAGVALAHAGACRAASRAAHWVLRLQVSGTLHGTALAGQQGAIAYDRAALRAGQQSGIGVAEQDQWRRATSQAAPVLGYLSVPACLG